MILILRSALRARGETVLRANGSRECAPDDRLREAIHAFLNTEQWIASSLSLLAMTKATMRRASLARLHLSNSPRVFKHSFAISPRLSREVCFRFLPLRDQRAQGIPGAQCTRSLACEIK